MIEWDETDVLTVLEVLPEVNYDDMWHRFIVAKDGLTLEVTIFIENDVQIQLFCDEIEAPIFRTTLMNCFRIGRVKDENCEYLEIVAPCPSGTSIGDTVIEMTIAIPPYISVELKT